MEIIIAIAVILVAGFYFYNRKPKDSDDAAKCPFKVEAAPTAQAEVNTVADQATQAVVESIPAPAKVKLKQPGKPATKKAPAKKTAAKATPAKATAAKKPRAKKTTTK